MTPKVVITLVDISSYFALKHDHVAERVAVGDEGGASVFRGIS